MKNAFTEIFSYSFKLFSCIITFLLLPLSFIYNVNALLAVSYPFDIACDLSIAQLTLILLLLVVSVVLGLLSLTTYSLVKNNGVKIFYRLINAAAILIIVGYVAKYFRHWLIETFRIPLFSILTWLPLTIIISTSMVLIYLFSKYMSSEVNHKILEQLFKCFIATVITGIVLLSLKAVNYITTEIYRSNLGNSDISRKLETGNQAANSNLNSISKSQPNIVLVTFDALAAEDMSLYGYHINTTPNIGVLAKKSYIFNTMIANSNWTRPSSASIIIGKYPTTHKIFDGSVITGRMSYNRENLANVLRENGYKTAAITSNIFTHPLQNMTFRDFDYLPDTITNRSLLPPVKKIFSFLPTKFLTSSTSSVLLMEIMLPFDSLLIRYMPAYFAETPYTPDLVFEKALKFIISTEAPFFVWIHIWPPHDPYLPSGQFRYTLLNERTFDTIQGFSNIFKNFRYQAEQQLIIDKLRLRYDENIMYADDAFGKFINTLFAKGIFENSILIVTSDHGESFRKGYLYHGGVRLENLYQQIIHIPLLIHLPKQQIGKRIRSNGEHVDIAPTILDLLDIKVPSWMEGESLKQAMYHDIPTKKPKYSMNLMPNTVNHPISKGAIAIIKGDYKYIFQIDDNRGELYNIINDPYENRNLVNIESNTAEELKQLANIYRKTKRVASGKPGE